MEDWRWHILFRTIVSCGGKLATIVIDGGSISKEAIDKLGLKEKHPKPYIVAWVGDQRAKIDSRCLVKLRLGNDTEVWCDVMPMAAATIILGRLLLFDQRVITFGMQTPIPFILVDWF